MTEVYLWDYEEEDMSRHLPALRSMPSLRILELPVSCAESAADAEALYGLTMLTTLRFCEMRERDGDDGELVEDVGEWVLDLTRLTTLTCLFPLLSHVDGRATAGCEQQLHLDR